MEISVVHHCPSSNSHFMTARLHGLAAGEEFIFKVQQADSSCVDNFNVKTMLMNVKFRLLYFIPVLSILFANAALAATATQLAIAAGNNQTAVAGTAVSGPVCVIATDAGNNAVSGVSITWGN